MNLEFDICELTTLALSMSGAAAGSQIDGRLRTAADEYRLAARLWDAVATVTQEPRYADHAQSKRELARAMETELATITAEGEVG